LTVIESLRNRAGLIVSGAASFVVVIGGMRFASGEPLVQPQTDLGIVIGVAMVALYLVLNDTRGGGQ
jgi:multisubunit Na+/H+ antiporter MnhC subunit